MLFFRQWRHVAHVMEHFAFPGNIDFAADEQDIAMYYSWKAHVFITQNNKHNKWLEILDFQLKLPWRTPTKIHLERRRRRQQDAARKAQRTSFSTAKATSSTQRPRTCTEAATKYYNYTANGADEERADTDCRRFKKRWGDQATLTVYSKIIFFDATIGSSSYTICTMHVKNTFPTDWGQPLHLEQQWVLQ